MGEYIYSFKIIIFSISKRNNRNAFFNKIFYKSHSYHISIKFVTWNIR